MKMSLVEKMMKCPRCAQNVVKGKDGKPVPHSIKSGNDHRECIEFESPFAALKSLNLTHKP